MFGATRKSKNATLALKRHFWAHWMVSQAKTFSQAGERWVGIASWRLTQHHLSTWLSGARKWTIARAQCSVAQSGSGKLRALAFINETMNQNINNHFPWFYHDFTNFTRLEWKIQELNQGKIVADQNIFMASTISKKLNYLDIRTLFRFWYTRKFSNVTYVHQKNKEENVHIKLPKFRQMDGIRKADFLIISHK